MSFRVVNPEALAAPKGWNHGLLAERSGRILFVAGQTAAEKSGEIAERDFVAQFAKALDNVLAVVRAAGGEHEHIGRMTIYVTDIEAYRAAPKSLGEVYRERMGRHYPAMALVAVSSLVDARALVEIEATAVLPSPGNGA
jgi:enamine deaminase RidA (YjgF/YER057c/UK114 family)